VLLSAVAVGSDFSFEPSQRSTIGVAAGLTVLTGALNSITTAWMERIQKTFVVFHVTVVVTCIITLLAVEKNKNRASFVFANVQSASGWDPKGFAFLFGFLSAAFTMTNYGKLSPDPVDIGLAKYSSSRRNCTYMRRVSS
jgi:amino acid transporter